MHSSKKGPQLNAIAVITRDRPSALSRCLESYLSALNPEDRSTACVTVIDDTYESHISELNIRASIDIGRKWQVKIAYAGVEQRTKFVDALSREGISRDLLRYGLAPEQQSIRTAGANRNSSLLVHSGRMFLSVDDDTECRCIQDPRRQNGVRIESSTYNSVDPVFPCNLRSYSHLADVISYNTRCDIDIYALHRRIIGRPLVECVREFGDSIETRMRLGTVDAYPQDWRVIITLNGLAGDCGWGSPTHYLWLRGRALESLIHSESHYRMACSSRSVLRVVDCLTFTKGCGNMMSPFFAADNREILPPFPPLGRGQDVVFGRIASTLYPNAYFGHLPEALYHNPIEMRDFNPGEIVVAALGVDLCTFLVALIASFPNLESIDRLSPTERFEMIGARMKYIGNLLPEQANSLLRDVVLAFLDAQFEELQFAAEKYGSTAPFWKKDIDKILKLQKAMRGREGYYLPVEFRKGMHMRQALAASQSLLRNYGSLLEQWPRIVGTALELRLDGNEMEITFD